MEDKNEDIIKIQNKIKVYSLYDHGQRKIQ